MLPIKIDIPDGFLREEERCGYMVSAEMKKVWAVEIDLLFQIINLCKKHSIKYFVEGGTMLGVARHGGFIPWDDDIDVAMLRDDYDRFRYFAEKELEAPYFMQDYKSDPHCLHGHIQVRNTLTTGILNHERRIKLKYNQGIFVDVFPYDNIPDDVLEGEAWANATLRLKYVAFKKLMSIEYPHYFACGNWLSKLIMPYAHNVKERICLFVNGKTYSDYMKLFESSITKYRHQSTKSVTCSVLSYSPRKIWDRNWFSAVKYLKFEWFEVPVPVGYTQYLDLMYGDWHKYVMGSSFHGGILFDAEQPFGNYL